VLFTTFERLFDQGGWVVYPIYFVSVFAWYIVIGTAYRYRFVKLTRKRFFEALEGKVRKGGTGMHTFDNLLSKIKLQSANPQSVLHATDEFMANLVPKLNNGFSTISAIIVISPLLGLLGTISGMNEMFSVIGEFGFGNPGIMSNAISIALLASLTGLAVAVALLLFQDSLQTKRSNILNMLKNDCKVLVSCAEAACSRPNVHHRNRKGTAMIHSDYRLINDEQEKPEINLAPFVDTIMILLIFFVVTANLYVETGVDVTKPKAQSSTPAGQKAVLVGLTREGTVHVYGRQVTLERLRLLIEKECSKQSDLSVVIVADKDVGTGRTVQVMDQCALGGAHKISIAAGKE